MLEEPRESYQDDISRMEKHRIRVRPTARVGGETRVNHTVGGNVILYPRVHNQEYHYHITILPDTPVSNPRFKTVCRFIKNTNTCCSLK